MARIAVERPIVHRGAAAIAADFHVPLTDHKYVGKFLEHCEQVGMQTLIVAGDFWNLDSLSSFDSKQQSAGLEREIADGNSLMRRLLGSFDRVLMCWGNHDARLHKTLGYRASFATAMRMLFHDLAKDELGRLTISNLDHVIVKAGKRPWYVCHPKSYSSTPLTGARKIAAVKGMNVLTAHSHHCAIGYAADGVHVVAELGGFFDAKATEYLQRSTAFPLWTQGYALIDESGMIDVHSPGWTGSREARAA